MIAWLIRFPGDTDNFDWVCLLQSEQCSSIDAAYQSLIDALRIDMPQRMG
jgi:hypothetical protein